MTQEEPVLNLQRTRVQSQCPHGSSQQPGTLVPEELPPSSGLPRHCTWRQAGTSAHIFFILYLIYSKINI